MITNLPYRKNVAVFVLNEEGKILACRRSDHLGWQLPQGGVDDNETLEQAMYREVGEEIGTVEVKLLGNLEEPIRYEWPEHLHQRGFRGQEQYYFLVRLEPGAELDLQKDAHPEFDAVQWLSAEEFNGCLAGFKAEAYSCALSRLQRKYPGIIT